MVGDVFVGDVDGELDVEVVCKGLSDCLAKLYMLSGVALGSSCLLVLDVECCRNVISLIPRLCRKARAPDPFEVTDE